MRLMRRLKNGYLHAHYSQSTQGHTTAIGLARRSMFSCVVRSASSEPTHGLFKLRNTSLQTRPSILLPQRRNASLGPVAKHGSAHEPSRTALYDLHLQHGGKMVPFGGFSMPVQYKDLSVGDSHKWTREKASLFDVGHMVQHHFAGPGAAKFLERITPISTASLGLHQSSLSCFLHPVTGGIVDDTVITRLGPELFYVVTNAACKSKDLAYLTEQLASFDKGFGVVNWTIRDEWGLVALQGPKSVEILKRAFALAWVEDGSRLNELYFGQCREVFVQLPSQDDRIREPLLISRGGYTGEDGFEISIPPALVLDFTRHLLAAGGNDNLRLAGLGARDSLRLEAGMCLYGHDLDDSTTPVEAGLNWIVAKDRRITGGFHGAETILRQLQTAKEGGGVQRCRVGLIVEGAPAREGADIISLQGDELGKVTSGCPSPTLGTNIAMGYVKSGMHKAGTKLEVAVRGKRRKAEVVKMPFVKSRYWKGAAGTSPG